MMKKLRALNWIGISVILVMLQWSLYGCGGSSDSPRIDIDPGITPPLQTYEDPVTGMEFVLVPGGCFNMGNNFRSDYAIEEIDDELPVHEVCIDSFYMGRHPVTQGEWQEIMGDNPSFFNDCGADCPVERVSWNDVQNYLEKLNAVGEKTFRLSTEAEWEYAARSGGKLQKYAGTSDDGAVGEYAWYSANSGQKTQPKGGTKPNGLGLYDMSGNVMEWVHDLYGPYPETDSIIYNPTGPESGELRVFRGSSCLDTLRLLRASIRDFEGPDFKANGVLGFRLVFPADQ